MSRDTVNLIDGKGKGYGAEVNSDNELAVSAQSQALRANLKGDSYSALCDVTSASTDDDFFYLMNTSARNLIIYKIQCWCDDAKQEISVLIGATDAGTAAGDTITPGNLNQSKSNVADVTCTSDATDLAITGGTAIDLLMNHTTAEIMTSFDFPAGIILGPNGRMHCQAALAGLINMNVFFYFKDV